MVETQGLYQQLTASVCHFFLPNKESSVAAPTVIGYTHSIWVVGALSKLAGIYEAVDHGLVRWTGTWTLVHRDTSVAGLIDDLPTGTLTSADTLLGAYWVGDGAVGRACRATLLKHLTLDWAY